MTHFAEEVWADYVRGTGASETKQQLAAHLADNCAVCKKADALWSRVQTLAAREAEYQAPPDLVRLAKLQFERQAFLWRLSLRRRSFQSSYT